MPTMTAAAAARPSRYESQKRRDWQTFTRYLSAHRPPLQLRWCSGAHVLEFLRYLDRFGKTRVHAPPCPSYGGREGAAGPSCRCPLRQAWGSLDALVGRLRAAFDERHPGPRGGGGGAPGDVVDEGAGNNNPFAARAVRLYLRDVRDAQSAARGISYNRKKKKKKKRESNSSGGVVVSKDGDAVQQTTARTHVNDDGAALLMATATAAAAPELHHPYPPPPLQQAAYSLNDDVPPFECRDFSSAGVLGGGGASASTASPAAGFYGAGTFSLPLLFNTLG